MGLIKECDRYIEFGVQNIRSGIEDCFWVKKNVAEILMTWSFIWLDALQRDNLINWLVDSSINFFIMKLASSGWPQKRNNIWEVKSIDPIIEFYKKFRFIVVIFITASIFNSYDRVTLLPLYLYLVFKFHDDNDRGIKNLIKWELKKLRSTIKVPWAQPSPV